MLYGEVSCDAQPRTISGTHQMIFALPLKRALLPAAGFSSNLVALMIQAVHQGSHSSNTGTTNVLHATYGRKIYQRLGTVTLQFAGGWAAQNIQDYCEDPGDH